MICAIYTRKSKADEASQSIETQIEMCKEYIYKHFPESEIRIYDKDSSITGHSIKNRKDFQRLINDVKNGYINVVLVQRYDRLSRNMRDFCNIYYTFEKHNCALVSVGQDIDTSTPYGKKFMYDMASTAELEWGLNSIRHKDVNNYAASIGKCNVGRAPIGYTFGYENGMRKLIKDDNTKHIIEDMINYLSTGGARSSVAKYINDKYNTKYSHALFDSFKRSTFYYGEYKGNTNYCEPYLTKEEFLKITKNVSTRYRQHDEDYRYSIFTGLIICPVCGYRCEPHPSVSRGNYNKYYRCKRHFGPNICSYNLSLPEKKIEKQLLEIIDEYVKNIEIQTKIKSKQNKKSNLSKYQEELNRLNNMYLKGRIDEEFYDKEYLRLNLLIEDEKNNLEEKQVDIDSLKKIFDKNWKSIYENLTNANKKRFWAATIKEIHFTEDKKIKDIIFL